MSKLAANIGEIGWSQSFFARSIGVKPILISQYIRQHREVPDEVILYISQVKDALNSIEKPNMENIGALTDKGRKYSLRYREAKKS